MNEFLLIKKVSVKNKKIWAPNIYIFFFTMNEFLLNKKVSVN